MEKEPPQEKSRAAQVNQTDPPKATDNPGSEKRRDYITWEDYFMGSAFLAAQRSKDPKTQVGAVIVEDSNRIVGIGYNGFPAGISDDEFPWGKRNFSDHRSHKRFYVCHAEVNAVLNRNSASTKGCRLYVTHFPCCECTKIIVQSQIKEVVYACGKKLDEEEMRASERMLSAVGIKCRYVVVLSNAAKASSDENLWRPYLLLLLLNHV